MGGSQSDIHVAELVELPLPRLGSMIKGMNYQSHLGAVELLFVGFRDPLACLDNPGNLLGVGLTKSSWKLNLISGFARNEFGAVIVLSGPWL